MTLSRQESKSGQNRWDPTIGGTWARFYMFRQTYLRTAAARIELYRQPTTFLLHHLLQAGFNDKPAHLPPPALLWREDQWRPPVERQLTLERHCLQQLDRFYALQRCTRALLNCDSQNLPWPDLWVVEVEVAEPGLR